MEAIYDRMASSIAKNPNPSARSLATRILECVTCSLRVLKVAELSQTLGGVNSEVLDLQRAIMDLCGDFVVVDNGGNVAMIHQTARDYLLNDPGEGRSFHIDRQAANRHMFLSSMQCLMSTGLRARLGRKKEPEFLEYASSSWSSHLASAPLHDHETVTTLKEFLTGNWVLTWIHALAASGQLRVLIRASKDLSRFVSRGKQQDPETGEGISILEQDLFDRWAVDLVRIVGKFSNLLRRNPDSIYKLIPPFCPKSSSIFQLFGKAEAKNLSVTGLSAETWDDSLARIPLGHDRATFASSIAAAGSQIAILAPSGSVFFYDSSDFMEARASPIKHGERVSKMQLNSTATLLATYGYRTTRIWEISTGKCKVSVDSVESKTRPLAMLFTDNNSTLLVGTDDRRVWSLNLNESQPTWKVVAELEEAELEGEFMVMNSASHVALSKDGSMVAIAYRSHPLSAWETDGPVHIGHCWRKNQAVAIRELRELFWHPHLPEILGLNLEGVVFKWAPYDREIDELPTTATKLSISRDGGLFATGDGHGRVKLYTTSTFSLLYQLAAQDAVLGLTFSPDSRRIYDIRGYYANAWEPDALIKLAEPSGKHMDPDSESQSLAQSLEESVVISRAIDSITALAGSPKGRLYCCGTEKGVVSLYDTQHGKLVDLHVSRAKFTIEKVVWSGDSKYICFTDMSKQVTVMSVTQGVGEIEPVVEQKAVIPIRKVAKGPVLQLLFQADSSHLLVLTSSQICTISLTSSSVEQSRELEDIQIQWIVQLGEPALIVGFGPSTIYVFDWNLVQRQKYSISWPLDNPPDKSNAASPQGSDAYQVDRVLVTYDKKHLFLQMSHSRDHSRGKQFFFFETSAISTSSPAENLASPQEHEDSQPPSVCLNALAADLSSNIALALSFLSKDRLVFLSKNFAICSAQIRWGPGPLSLCPVARSSITTTMTTMTASRRPSARGAVEDIMQEQFALPGDWISGDCLSVCSIWGMERSLLCPRNGEAAVVKCAALA
jgi:WD40 repeat protein